MNPTTIAVLPGDGIGPEVMQQTLRVLELLAPQLTFKTGLIGGAAYLEHQQHFPEVTKALIDQSAAVLFGSVGGPIDQAHLPQWHNCEVNSILALRNHLQLSANYRPAKFYPALRDISPLKNRQLDGCDEVLILRELLGDIYFGDKRRGLSRRPKRIKRSLPSSSNDIYSYDINQDGKEEIVLKVSDEKGGFRLDTVQITK